MFHWKAIGASALLALSDVATATVAPSFPVAAATDLTITFASNNTVSPPGELLPRADTLNPPNVTTPVVPAGGRGVVLIVDTDVPRNGSRVQLLHLLASNVTLGGDNKTLSIPTGEAPYRQPSPPVGDVAHAYTVLLFAQPADFSIPADFTQVLTDRVPFNISAFVAAARLGAPVAANYFRVQNTTGQATQSFPPPASTPTSNSTASPSQFPGSAAMVGEEKVWLMGVATVVMAGLMGLVL